MVYGANAKRAGNPRPDSAWNPADAKQTLLARNRDVVVPASARVGMLLARSRSWSLLQRHLWHSAGVTQSLSLIKRNSARKLESLKPQLLQMKETDA